jgi:hypothetical protein
MQRLLSDTGDASRGPRSGGFGVSQGHVTTCRRETPCVSTWRKFDEGGLARFARAYKWVCVVGAVIGITATIYFFVTGPTDVGWVLGVLTVLLLPACLLVQWRARKGL